MFAKVENALPGEHELSVIGAVRLSQTVAFLGVKDPATEDGDLLARDSPPLAVIWIR